MSLNSNGSSAAVSARKGKFRFVILTVLSVGIAINYIDRAAMSVAIPFMSQELHFSPTDSGLLLSAFFWSYVLFQLPGGWLVDKLGPRITFAVSSLGWGLATAACGLASSFVRDSAGDRWRHRCGVKEKWGNLTDDDLTVVEGKREQLVGKIQERYGYEKERAEKEVKEWEDSGRYHW